MTTTRNIGGGAPLSGTAATKGAEVARNAAYAGRALQTALRSSMIDAGEVGFHANTLVEVLKKAKPGFIADDELAKFARMGKSAVVAGDESRHAGYELMESALSLRDRAIKATLKDSPDARVRDALGVLGKLGKVEVGATTEGDYYVSVGDAGRMSGEFHSTNLSGFFASVEEGVKVTAYELKTTGVGIATTDRADGQRKPMTWNGDAFVPAKWDAKREGWYPKDAA